jgi:2-polyprenyl-3-methyl-5-hydroxy-6-metoxy-1,4-benzoquinol methylase
MSRLTRLLRGERKYRAGHPEALWRDLIARHAPDRTFVDVGCMWKVHGEYAFHALASGASAATGIDISEATLEFLTRNAEKSEAVRFVQIDLNTPSLEERLGRFDVVFCAGVLYHLPNPLASLGQLRRLCRETLILATAGIVEQSVPQTAVFLPGLGEAARRRLDFWSPHGSRKVGLDSSFAAERGYGNWFWLPTPSCVRALVEAAGFTVRECHAFRHGTTVVATPA